MTHHFILDLSHIYDFPYRRQLLATGISVTAFEKGPSVGGTWNIDDIFEDEGVKPTSALYNSLTTNLPIGWLLIMINVHS